jgi:hypothetical protein
MEKNKNNHIPEITPTIEENSADIQISVPFSITWEDKEYYGNFIITSFENIGNKDYEIEWLDDEIPDFGEFEDQIYEKLTKKLSEEVSKRYNI